MEYIHAHIKSYMELRKSLSVSVKIDHEEIDLIVVNKLIAFRGSTKGKMVEHLDFVIRGYFLSEEEFERYVINGEKIEE